MPARHSFQIVACGFEARKLARIERWKREAQISSGGVSVRRVAAVVPASLLNDQKLSREKVEEISPRIHPPL